MNNRVKNFIDRVDAIDNEIRALRSEIWRHKRYLSFRSDYKRYCSHAEEIRENLQDLEDMGYAECANQLKDLKANLEQLKSQRLSILAKQTLCVNLGRLNQKEMDDDTDIFYELSMSYTEDDIFDVSTSLLDYFRGDLKKEGLANVVANHCNASILVGNFKSYMKTLAPIKAHLNKKSSEIFLKAAKYVSSNGVVACDYKDVQNQIYLDINAQEVFDLADKAYIRKKNGEREVQSERLAKVFDTIINCAE